MSLFLGGLVSNFESGNARPFGERNQSTQRFVETLESSWETLTLLFTSTCSFLSTFF